MPRKFKHASELPQAKDLWNAVGLLLFDISEYTLALQDGLAKDFLDSNFKLDQNTLNKIWHLKTFLRNQNDEYKKNEKKLTPYQLALARQVFHTLNKVYSSKLKEKEQLDFFNRVFKPVFKNNKNFDLLVKNRSRKSPKKTDLSLAYENTARLVGIGKSDSKSVKKSAERATRKSDIYVYPLTKAEEINWLNLICDNANENVKYEMKKNGDLLRKKILPKANKSKFLHPVASGDEQFVVKAILQDYL